MTQSLMFPMKFLKVTQGYGIGTHKGTMAVDFAGKDSGIDEVYAPCDMKIKYKDTQKNGNAIFFESMDKVKFADGTVDYATILMIHANNIDNFKVGTIFMQNELCYWEGTSGQATGNHLHLEIAKGTYEQLTRNANARPYERNKYNLYGLPKGIAPHKAFFVPNDTKILITGGYSWTKYSPGMSASHWVACSGARWKYKKDNGMYAKSEWIFDEEYSAWYYFDENCYMMRSSFVPYENHWCYLEADGKMFKGGTIRFRADNSGYLKKI